ncbi:MAG: DUF4390 domain-containing protein [Betaproteobacteria bacterium]|nr:DUF4390 domain-containing protein [Betaproteobacteria bacterium]
MRNRDRADGVIRIVRPRNPLLLWLAYLLLAIPSGAAWAEPSIHVRSAEVSATADGLTLDANFQIDLGPTLEEALSKGLSLYFVAEFDLVYERWYLLNLWNRTIGSFEQHYRLNFNTLTRQYRLTVGSLTQNVETLDEALAIMSRIRNRLIASPDDYEKGQAYTAEIRLRLDPSQLPKPFQLSSIGSKSWNLSSDWYRWTVRP